MDAGEDLETLRATLPPAAADVASNVQNVLASDVLSDAQRWGVALATAYTTRTGRVIAAVRHEIDKLAERGFVEDAKVAAVLMAQNNVYYRFRHMLDKSSYDAKPARLSMSKRRQVTSKPDYELFALAVSAVNGCAVCVRHHEQQALELGLTERHVNDAVRIAATIHALAVALAVQQSE